MSITQTCILALGSILNVLIFALGVSVGRTMTPKGKESSDDSDGDPYEKAKKYWHTPRPVRPAGGAGDGKPGGAGQGEQADLDERFARLWQPHRQRPGTPDRDESGLS
jgi:hypothetical protein